MDSDEILGLITFEDLRALRAKTAALAHATVEIFDNAVHVDAVRDPRRLARLARGVLDVVRE